MFLVIIISHIGYPLSLNKTERIGRHIFINTTINKAYINKEFQKKSLIENRSLLSAAIMVEYGD